MPYLVAINFHDRRPSPISTSKISHVTEDWSWLWVNAERNQLTHVWPVEYEIIFFNATDPLQISLQERIERNIISSK